jgi:hypothetical protein
MRIESSVDLESNALFFQSFQDLLRFQRLKIAELAEWIVFFEFSVGFRHGDSVNDYIRLYTPLFAGRVHRGSIELWRCCVNLDQNGLQGGRNFSRQSAPDCSHEPARGYKANHPLRVRFSKSDR